MTVTELSPTTEDMPPASPEIVLWRVAMMSFLSVVDRKTGEKFLAAMAETLADEQAVSQIVPIRGSSSFAAVQDARKRAVAIFHAFWPIFRATLSRK